MRYPISSRTTFLPFPYSYSLPLYNTQEFNIAVIGAKKSGKTQFCRAITLHHNKSFKRTKGPHKGVERFPFLRRTEETLLKINLWDFKAKDEYRQSQLTYIKSMHGCFIFYDTTHKDALTSLLRSYKFFKENSPENSFCMILGTKVDILGKRAITQEEVERFAMLRRIDSLEISSLKKINIEEALAKMTNQLLINFDNINTDVLGNKFEYSVKSSQVETASFKGNQEDDISKESEERDGEMSDYSMTNDPENDRDVGDFEGPKEELKSCCKDACQIF